jgi:predicted molibdopterin-dependent oxidoreductase YjgC
VRPVSLRESGESVEVHVDGLAVAVAAGATLLDACDAAGRYVPRLCFHPGLVCRAGADAGGSECGICLVRLGDGSTTLACVTAPVAGMQVTTDDPGLRLLRLERLSPILTRHPHICLTCPDRDGCARDVCTYGMPPDARCCDEFGGCEFGKVAAFVDPGVALPRRPVTVSREAAREGRIRREPGLCVGCGRCVRVCESAPEAGEALELALAPGEVEAGMHLARVLRRVARPKKGTLRSSGCTFCGLCVMVCPAGALTAPGEAGARWLDGRRKRASPAATVLPPEGRQAFTAKTVEAVTGKAGVFRLLDREGRVLRISGVADLRRGLIEALADRACVGTAYFQLECDPLFTQRESELLAAYAREWGHLPPGNDLGDELFADDE